MFSATFTTFVDGGPSRFAAARAVMVRNLANFPTVTP